MEQLKFLKNLIESLEKTNSSNEKQVILKINSIKNEELFSKFMEYTYSYQKQYYVTSSNLKKNSDLILDKAVFNDIFSLLDSLDARLHTGHDAIKLVNTFIRQNKDYEDIIHRIIDRDLKCGVGKTIINKVIKCIPVFKVALADKYSDNELKKTNKENWLISRKIDGVRCIAIVDEKSNSKFFSRQGKEFEVLQKVRDEIKTSGIKDCVLDGEICIVDDKDNEDFQSVMKEIRRKDHTIENPVYKIFDILSHKEFNDQTSSRTFMERYRYNLVPLFVNEDKSHKSYDTLRLVVQHGMKDFEFLKQQSAKNNWEGLMFRRADQYYKGKRSKDILKYKVMSDAEYKVVGIEESTKPFLIDGIMKELPCVGNLIIEHKGNKVGVGSGLSDKQKREWLAKPEQIVGKVITVQYFEETQNQDGEYSLRFPVLKHIWKKNKDL